MEYVQKDGKLTILLKGRIDTSNAETIGAEIDAILASCGKPTGTTLDVEGVEYISSAGLRMVLRLRKADPELAVVNASSEVYEIFEMTGFTEMLSVSKAYRKMSVDGCTVIGEGAKGIVYRYNDDTVVKVYKNADALPDILRERELSRRAFVLGIPTAISYDVVRVGEGYASVFELLDAKSYSEKIVEDPAHADDYIRDYAELLRKIHETPVKESDVPAAKAWTREWVDVIRPYVDASLADRVAALIDELPEQLTLLHGDYHTNNLMYQNGEAILIDMDTLSRGYPILELGNVCFTYVSAGEADHPFVENFLGMPFEKTCEVWEKFLPIYLGTTDEARIRDVERKAQIVAYTRLIRHYVRRGVVNASVEHARRRLTELLPQVDTLTF